MQPQKVSCENCGADLLEDARFCRRCGQPSNSRGSVTEVTTRRLESPGRPFVNVGDAPPAGQSPLAPQGRTQQVSGIETERLPQRTGSRLQQWLPGLVILLIAVLLPTVYVLRQWTRPVVIAPPAAPERPAIPQPPKPPAPPGQSAATGIDPAYVYPGAHQTMVVSKPGKNMVQLETEDSVDKVADWYIEKFKPTEIVRRPDSAVLKGEKIAVILNSNGKGTNIMLSQRGD